MTTKRYLLALIAFTFLLPLSGCGCRRNCCSSGAQSYAPPPACCDKVPLPPVIPTPNP